ncbi:MAG: SagB/ThcOx family dehydrogenase [Syntrophorhabdaceae bacterium]|nr:SagB/ThcOx family dehydrogenase [Syntrophorhabdaceae bacterium]
MRKDDGSFDIIDLRRPKLDTKEFFTDLLAKRCSVRSFTQKPVALDVISYILWAGYGFKEGGGRTVPSAGATYPLELYLLCRMVEGGEIGRLDPGLYVYIPELHRIKALKKGDVSRAISEASLFQMWIAEAPFSIIICCEYRRITNRYRERGIRYAYMEAGEVSQNISLACLLFGLGSCIVGAFDDRKVKSIMDVNPSHEPVLIIPVGYPRL